MERRGALGLILTVLFLEGCAGLNLKNNQVQQAIPPQTREYHPLPEGSPGRVRLAFVGDINLGRRVETLLDEKGKKWMLEDCKSLLDSADLVAANLESPVGEGGAPFVEKSVYLKGRPDALDALAYGGLGLVTLANNHILDYGPEVALQTQKALTERGILSTGLVGQGQPHQTVYVRVHGLTLAFLGYCSVCPDGFGVSSERPGVKTALPSVMGPEIRRAKAKADFVIVMIHWGQEYYGVNALQERLAKSLALSGADLVIGSHPHVLQKVEKLGTTLVAYSLGDFIFDLHYPVCQDSCVLQVELQKNRSPRWSAFPLDLISGRPEPLKPESRQAKRIQRILRTGYEYGGKKRYPESGDAEKTDPE
jgi:poly-gamma-glutamate capsule biosynthesis protein CapA/YwtB (metallophosphatase superfamily)